MPDPCARASSTSNASRGSLPGRARPEDPLIGRRVGARRREPRPPAPEDLDEDVGDLERGEVFEELFHPVRVFEHALRALRQHPERPRPRRRIRSPLPRRRVRLRGQRGVGLCRGEPRKEQREHTREREQRGEGRHGRARLQDARTGGRGREPSAAGCGVDTARGSRTLSAMGRGGVYEAAAALACAVLLLASAVGAADERPGLALRAALAEDAAGRHADAATAFEEVARRWPVIGDHALQLAAEAWLDAGQADRALQAALRVPREHPQSPLLAEAMRVEAEAHLARGEPTPAIDAYRRAHVIAETTEERRVLRAALAQTLEDAGQLESAHENWLVLWRQVPGTPEDERAVAALARLEAAGLPAPAAGEWAHRARSLAEAHDAAGAVAAFDRALTAGVPERMQKQLERERAFSLFRAREYPRALAAFEALGPDPEARLYRARSLARSGKQEKSIEAFEEVGLGRSREAWRARFLVATLLDDAPETRARAVGHYAAVAQHSPDSGDRESAAWRLAWLEYIEGRLAEAAASFDRLASGDPIAALRPRYWAARTRAELDPAAAAPRTEFVEMARRYPLTYYGWRAASHVEGSPTQHPEPATLARGQQRLGGAPVARVRILIEAGLPGAAGDEVVRLEGRARTLADRLLLAGLAEDAERPDRARVLAALGNEVALARGPAPGLEELWWRAWPRPWQAQVEGAAGTEGVEPELVWAVMREESGFRSAVVSPAGAHGLLQLMPETAGARPHVDHEVRGADRLLVVLDDDDGVAQVAQALHRRDEAGVVPLVQSDRRLVEYVEHPHEPRADLGGEPDALRLAAGQGRGGALERQVVEAHVDKEAQPLDDLLHDTARDRLVSL